MKKLSKLLLLTALAFWAPVSHLAASSIYTFSGSITQILDIDNLLSATGLSPGDEVTYRFLIDFDRPGSYTRQDGTVVELASGPTYNYFYADLLTPTYIPGDPSCCNASDYVTEYNFLAEDSVTTDSLQLGSGNVRFLGIYSSAFDAGIGTWPVGTTTIAFSERLFVDGSGSYDALIGTQLTLQSINPVPVPPALFLFLSGILALYAGTRKRSNS